MHFDAKFESVLQRIFLKTRAAVAPDPDVWIAKSMPCIFKAATFSMISFFVLISRQ